MTYAFRSNAPDNCPPDDLLFADMDDHECRECAALAESLDEATRDAVVTSAAACAVLKSAARTVDDIYNRLRVLADRRDMTPRGVDAVLAEVFGSLDGLSTELKNEAEQYGAEGGEE